ncbi:MAG TPA: hypothetical protein VGK37_05255 [Casimicrobiaceae bacterium]|jgi:predicted NAD/FAD-dependent oxidoreductase
MAVVADGWSHIIEQLGEKQDFESELSRLGYRHEDFRVTVRRARLSGQVDQWTATYTVCVTDLRTSRSNVYWGGPHMQWVAQFAADLAIGFFGEPRIVREPVSIRRGRANG